MKNLCAIISLLLLQIVYAQMDIVNIDALIDRGEFRTAKEIIAGELARPCPDTRRYELLFCLERMDRIKKDFNKSQDDIIAYLKKYFPSINASMLETWEKDNSLEMMMIDGEKKYFANAGPNLFRINSEARAKKLKIDGAAKDALGSFLADDIPQLVSAPSQDHTVGISYNYTLTLDNGVVPEGEQIRCWLPFPREDKRQIDLQLTSVNLPNSVIAPNDYLQRTIYMEKIHHEGIPDEFAYSLTYKARPELHFVNFDALNDIVIPDSILPYTKEEAPHIVFTEEIKKLSDKILSGEQHKGKIIKLIFEWIDTHIPWASAREYSTIPNISQYCLTQSHGDCGIKTLLFMTLCRYNGIPARWQSGWMFHPGAVNLHDWCKIYVGAEGWVPVDQSFGLLQSNIERVKWFFLGNTDAYHFIVNDGYGQPLFPAKVFPRSETVDFQRGEVEWKCKNLYFDEWNYNMKVNYKNLSH